MPQQRVHFLAVLGIARDPDAAADGDALAFRAPGFLRSGPVDEATLDAFEARSRRLVACLGNNDGPELRARLRPSRPSAL